MKCLACGFEHNAKAEEKDRNLCRGWAHLFALYKGFSVRKLPSKEQFEAMQREEFLPTHGEENGRKWEVYYGHYGWAVDYDWPSIAAKITQGTLSQTA